MSDPRKIQIATPSLGEEEWEALRDPIQSGWLTQGPKVAGFERLFAELHAVPHALATSSCTTALHLGLVALGVGPGDEVIVPAFTWISTANVVLYCGATPVFADIDPVTFNIDVDDALSKVTDKTKAVIAVHLFGLCADVEWLRARLPDHIRIMEDAACAAGARSGNTYAGAQGDVAAFSFHPRKSVTTGEGGMLTTTHPGIAALAEKLRNHGASISEEQRHHGPRPHIMPDFNVLGFNYRMTDLQGAVGMVQIRKLRGFITERAELAAQYRRSLSDLSWLTCPKEPANGNHAWQSFVIQVDEAKAPRSRNEMMDALQAKGIATRPGTHAVHMLHYYVDRFGLRPEDFPAAAQADRQSLAIPLHNRMTRDDQDYVIETLHELA